MSVGKGQQCWLTASRSRLRQAAGYRHGRAAHVEAERRKPDYDDLRRGSARRMYRQLTPVRIELDTSCVGSRGDDAERMARPSRNGVAGAVSKLSPTETGHPLRGCDHSERDKRNGRRQRRNAAAASLMNSANAPPSNHRTTTTASSPGSTQIVCPPAPTMKQLRGEAPGKLRPSGFSQTSQP